MEIKTQNRLTNQLINETERDAFNKLWDKKWVAVDDILPIIKELHSHFSYEENVRINSKNSQDLDAKFYKLEKELTEKKEDE